MIWPDAGTDLRASHPELMGIDLMGDVGVRTGAAGGARSEALFQWTSLVHLSAAFVRFFAGLRNAKTPEQRAKAAAGGPPDLTPYRGHMRGIFDGRFKFARYFSPRDHHRPENWDELIGRNDLELYDTHADPGETTNLARDSDDAPRERIESLNRALNALIDREVGVDDGGHLPGSAEAWQR